jgi:putative tryptophan/tyrosine transport system substrate-binding protein
MRRRDFIALIGGAAAACPVVARAQQPNQVRRIAVLMAGDENDPVRGTKGWLFTFTRRLAELGWTDGRNLRMDVRWDGDNVDRTRMYAKELADLQPDVILAPATPQTAAFQQQTRTIPIVFVLVSDPIGSGFVASLPRPGGNITGFRLLEAGMAGKWLELLTEIAPAVTRAALMFNPDTAPFVRSFYLPLFEAAARSLKLVPIAAPVHNDAEIETVIGSLGGEPGGGLVIAPDAFTTGHRSVIISLATRNNVPTVSGDAAILRDGGLLSYGPDLGDMFHRAALYVDRILRGARPDELPVQLPIKFVMAINLKTAKALGLDVPWFLQQRADEVIE